MARVLALSIIALVTFADLARAQFPPPPPPLLNVKAVHVARTGAIVDAEVRWSPLPAIVTYRVAYTLDAHQWLGEVTTKATSIRMPCPQIGTPIGYRVIAGTLPPAYAVLTCHDRPALPTSVVATRLSDTSIRVQWQDNSTIETSYRVNLSRQGIQGVEQHVFPPNTTNVVLSNLLPQTIYYVQIFARTNSDVTGDLGTDHVMVATGTPPPLPQPPTNLTAVAISSSEIDLAWSTAETAPHRLEIEHSFDGIAWEPYYTESNSTSTAASDQGLDPGVRHYYRVRYANATGVSAYSNVATAFTFSTCTPAAPSGLTATATSSSTVHLRFTDNASGACNEEVFLLSMSYDNGATWSTDFANTIFTDVDVVQIAPSTPTTYRIRATAVINGQRVYSAYSNTASATTLAGPAASARFTNTSSYPVVSLVVDGIERIPHAPLGIAPGSYYELPFAPSSAHTWSATTGFWDGSSRFAMYRTTGTFTQPNGLHAVTIANPSIGGLLTLLSGSPATWVGETWIGTTLHTQAFCFRPDGSWRFYRDGALASSGASTTLTSYPTPGVFVVGFRVTSGGAEGLLDETTHATFYMRNGPADFPTVAYRFRGMSPTCP